MAGGWERQVQSSDVSSRYCYDMRKQPTYIYIYIFYPPPPSPFPQEKKSQNPLTSHLLHLTPLPLLHPHPQLPPLPHLHPLRPHKHPPVPPALEIALPTRDAPVILAHGLVERDADPGGAGGAGQRGDGADVGDQAAFGGGGGEAAAGGGADVCWWGVVRLGWSWGVGGRVMGLVR